MLSLPLPAPSSACVHVDHQEPELKWDFRQAGGDGNERKHLLRERR